MDISFEWNKEKAFENQRKHGISFDEAKLIFNGPLLTRADNRYAYDEARIIGLGTMKDHAVVLIAYTDRHDKIRIISARYATKSERKIYYESFKNIAPVEQFYRPRRRLQN